jgi:DNA invertase Pin-like site-specific DNA recombinase
MSNSLFVAYYRVSTARQGQSGLGLEAQEHAVKTYLRSIGGTIVASFTEVETGKGFKALEKRPQLRTALDACRKHAATLLIAKLDRLARNCAFVAGLLEAGCPFVAADMPHANKTMIQIYAAMSEWERDQISARVKAALAAAKARGVILGATGPVNIWVNLQQRKAVARRFVANLRPHVEDFHRRALTQKQMIVEFARLGVSPPRGGQWGDSQIGRLLKMIKADYDKSSPKVDFFLEP